MIFDVHRNKVLLAISVSHEVEDDAKDIWFKALYTVPMFLICLAANIANCHL